MGYSQTYSHTHIHVYTQTHPSCYHIYHNCNQWVPYQTTIQQLNYTFPAILSRDPKSGWQYLGNKDQYWRQAGVRTTRFLKAFDIFKKKKIFYLVIQDFWISGSGGHILGTRRATGDLLVAKLPHFLELFRYYKTIRFWITEFLVALSRRQKKATRDPLDAKLPDL